MYSEQELQQGLRMSHSWILLPASQQEGLCHIFILTEQGSAVTLLYRRKISRLRALLTISHSLGHSREVNPGLGFRLDP